MFPQDEDDIESFMAAAYARSEPLKIRGAEIKLEVKEKPAFLYPVKKLEGVLAEIPMKTRVTNALINSGIVSLEALLATPVYKLRQCKNLGNKSLTDLHLALTKAGVVHKALKVRYDYEKRIERERLGRKKHLAQEAHADYEIEAEASRTR